MKSERENPNGGSRKTSRETSGSFRHLVRRRGVPGGEMGTSVPFGSRVSSPTERSGRPAEPSDVEEVRSLGEVKETKEYVFHSPEPEKLGE